MKDNYDYYYMFDTTPLKEVRKEPEKRKQKLSKAKDWLCKSAVTLLVVGPPLIAVVTPAIVGITGVIKSANRRANLNKEAKQKELYCYDRSLGHYWQLKRKLSNFDWLEINQRREHGESLADILADMKVLKM
ncbi:MAG: hypothetical protein IJ192_10370 [Clostridia bacterium]|nr:hypothetical protein [Clostridia bacterium]